MEKWDIAEPEDVFVFPHWMFELGGMFAHLKCENTSDPKDTKRAPETIYIQNWHGTCVSVRISVLVFREPNKQSRFTENSIHLISLTCR